MASMTFTEPPFANLFFVAFSALPETIATWHMSHPHRLLLLVYISYAGTVPSIPVHIPMPLLIRLLLCAAPLRTWGIAKKAQTVISGTCASVLTISAARAVD
jgi:hypothetical protein